MMNTIAKRLLSEAGWGLKMRLYSGAFLSVMDMISDIMMINQFFEEGKDSSAKMILVSIAVNLAVQVVMVIIQNHKKSAWAILFEILLVVLCVKPVVDAARVAGGQEKAEDETADR